MRLRRLFAAALVAAFVFCAAPVEGPRNYRGCMEENRGGRILHRPGTVVEDFLYSNVRVYRFQPDDLPCDGRHIVVTTKINRFCPVANPMGTSYRSADRGR